VFSEVFPRSEAVRTMDAERLE